MSSMFARMGGVLAPIINMLHNHSPATPLIIFGTSPLLGAVLALALPETADRPLPDTVEDAENWDTRYHSVLSTLTGMQLSFSFRVVKKARCVMDLIIGFLLAHNESP